MSTINKKTLLPIILAWVALFSAYQQVAAQTPVEEGVTQIPVSPLIPHLKPPPPDAVTRQYGCGFGVNNESITAKVTTWYASGKSVATVTDVHLTRYHSAASASLTIEATGATSQTQSGIPMDGQWHKSTIYVVGNAGPRLTALTERPFVAGCNLSAMEP